MKHSFTLIELILVVLIMGLIYSLAIGRFYSKENLKIDNIANLKESLLLFKEKGDDKITFVLYDNCNKNAVLINDALTYENIDFDIFDELVIYDLDTYLNPKIKDYPNILLKGKSYDVCFKFTIYPNGSNDSYIVKNDSKYYVFKPYFEELKIVKTLDKAIETFLEKDLLPGPGTYYENE